MDWLVLDSVDSTQNEAFRLLQEGASPDVILALEQTAGKGRFGRVWHSAKDECLAMSFILKDQSGHPKPWLLGMSLACVAAEVLYCRVRWPNDLYLEGKKLGGILTEILQGVPVVGIGVNLGQTAFPQEIADKATSLAMHRPWPHPPEAWARAIVQRYFESPLPQLWEDVLPTWEMLDDTPGKMYRLPSGEEAVATGIGPQGELLCLVDGKAKTVLAAEAVLG